MPIFISGALNDVRSPGGKSAVPRLPRPRRTSPAPQHSFEEAGSLNRFAHDDALGKSDAGERTELGVAALNQLAERWRIQACGHSLVAGGGELTLITRERGTLRRVMR